MKVGGDDVLRTRRNEDESVQLGLVERSSREGGATGRTTPRAPYSSEDMDGCNGRERRGGGAQVGGGGNWTTRRV